MHVSPSVTSDAPLTHEVEGIENANVTTVGFEADWVALGPDGLDLMPRAIEEPSVHSVPDPARKRSQRLKVRMRTALRKLSASIKMTHNRPLLSPVISPPERLDLPGYNRSVALALSSPIQVARFLYAAKVTHEKRHCVNKFPRNQARFDTPPFKYTPRHVPAPVSSVTHDINMSDNASPFVVPIAFHPTRMKGYDQRLIVDLHARSSSPQDMYTLLHEDIAYTLKSLRSLLAFDAPNEELTSFPMLISQGTLTRPSSKLQAFDPHRMPFAAEWVKQRTSATACIHTCGKPECCPVPTTFSARRIPPVSIGPPQLQEDPNGLKFKMPSGH
ncbi:hypothetical protein JB92DRAFT_818372 [Gautieria morchelliformis]|nr:hypothetical protein JB92DRAFT_818372 [Gautieria morchelliformis]